MQNPINMVDPDGEEPTPHEAALIAAHVYGNAADNIKLEGGWKVSTRNVGLTKNDFNNKDTGLKSSLYERTINGKTEYTYATAGTEPNYMDIKADIGEALLGSSSQYDKSVSNAKIIHAALDGAELTFVGHSLGGGEAAVNAIATGDKAITFNAAGVNITDKIEYGGLSSVFSFFSDIVTAYQMTNDPLSIMQDITPLPQSVGEIKMLHAVPNDKRNGHSILSVIDAIKN